MRISKTAIGVGLAAALASAVAVAGYKSGWEVGIDTVNRNAWGTLSTVRNSADNMQYIGCQVGVWSTGYPTVNCYARNADGTAQASCTATAANFVEQAQSIKGDSSIYFSWDAAGYCTYLSVANYSYLAPKNP